jgi:hypothetical protein
VYGEGEALGLQGEGEREGLAMEMPEMLDKVLLMTGARGGALPVWVRESRKLCSPRHAQARKSKSPGGKTLRG